MSDRGCDVVSALIANGNLGTDPEILAEVGDLINFRRLAMAGGDGGEDAEKLALRDENARLRDELACLYREAFDAVTRVDSLRAKAARELRQAQAENVGLREKISYYENNGSNKKAG